MVRHEVPPLGWWRLPGAIALAGLLVFAVGWLDHGPRIKLILVGSAVIGLALGVCAAIRAVVDEREVGALRIRSRLVDILTYALAASLIVGAAGTVYWRTYVHKGSLLHYDLDRSETPINPP